MGAVDITREDGEEFTRIIPVKEMPTEVATPREIQVAPVGEPTEVPYDTTPKRQQVGGDHYTQMSVQPFDIIASLNLDFFEGNALKYLLRYHRKGNEEDMAKCQHYIDILMAREKGVKEWWKTPPRQQ